VEFTPELEDDVAADDVWNHCCPEHTRVDESLGTGRVLIVQDLKEFVVSDQVSRSQRRIPGIFVKNSENTPSCIYH
jgi:hypothetical protein